jgi:malate dehydrogenase
MQTIAILGAGDLGGAVARAIACLDLVPRITIVDEAGALAAGKALDIRQSGPIEGFDTRLEGSDDLSRAAGAGIIVIADPHGVGEWDDEAALELLGRVNESSRRAVILCAGAGQLALLRRAASQSRIASSRLIGSAPVAAVGAARALSAAELDVSAADVGLTLVGAPPDWIVAWADATVAGTPLTRLTSPAGILRIEQRLRASWPPGPYQLASAAAAVIRAIVSRSRRRLCCYVADGNRLSVPVHVSMPALLGPEGVRAIEAPALAPRERVMLEALLRP